MLADRILRYSMPTVLIVSACLAPLIYLATPTQFHVYKALGVAYTTSTELRTLVVTFTIVLPAVFSLIAIVTAFQITYPLKNRRLIRQERCGICFGCAYDLRSTDDHCPECGRRVPSRHQASQLQRDEIVKLAEVALLRRRDADLQTETN